MSSYDFETFKGYCGNCRDLLDWKTVLDNIKDFKDQIFLKCFR